MSRRLFDLAHKEWNAEALAPRLTRKQADVPLGQLAALSGAAVVPVGR